MAFYLEDAGSLDWGRESENEVKKTFRTCSRKSWASQWCSSKESACQFRRRRRCSFDPGWGRSPGGGSGNPLQCSCLGSPMNRGAWWATVHGVEKSQTQLSTHLSAYTYEVNKSAEVFVGHFFVFNITGLEFPHFQNGIMPNSQIFVKYG